MPTLRQTSVLLVLLVLLGLPTSGLPGESLPGGAYQVGPNDVLGITVFDEPELSGSFTVTADGLIGFPLLGEIEVAGLSVKAIKDLVKGLLEKDYLYDANVNVVVESHKSRSVKIMGAVTRPGIYYLDSPTRLFALLSRAEGLSPRLSEIRKGQRVQIVRPAEGSRSTGAEGEPEGERIFVDLYALLVDGAEEANVFVENGDVIYVPISESIHVIGEVRKPGTYPYEAEMTVLKAITIAGGPAKKAASGHAFIKRIQDGKEVKLKVKMEDLLVPDDIVEVPLSFW